MNIPLRGNAVEVLRDFPNVSTDNIIRIIETIRDCYGVNTKFADDAPIEGETEETLAIKRLICEELTKFINELKNNLL